MARLEPLSTTTPCQNCALRALPIFRCLSGAELAFVEKFKIGELEVQAGSDILLAGTHSAHLFTIFGGWCFRYDLMEDGRRQIHSLLLPGDFIGLQTEMLGTMQHSVQSLTDVRLCVFSRERFWTIYESFPELAFDLTWAAACGERTVEVALSNVGQRPSFERLAALVVHLYRQLDGLRLVKDGTILWPLTQQHVADLLGLSTVHVSRVLRRLVDSGLVRLDGRRLTVVDLPALAEVAAVDPEKPLRRPLI
ncbi:MAG: Crp/Fnr family transcriptional regulator [Geminicoccaceae bacterium]|nr:Crp/Fnr family transcriptional regulator [Geminicoccaceae bacterium]HRY23784.1 Crp/Fnr family transcriptional regulator [Geminicoccaceae bacterium]